MKTIQFDKGLVNVFDQKTWKNIFLFCVSIWQTKDPIVKLSKFNFQTWIDFALTDMSKVRKKKESKFLFGCKKWERREKKNDEKVKLVSWKEIKGNNEI